MEMTVQGIQRYVRSLPEVREVILERARKNRNPCNNTAYEEVKQALDRLTSMDRDEWASVFLAVGEPHEARAREAESARDLESARREYDLAYGYYRVARYPAPNSPMKKEAYRRSQEMYLLAARYSDPPIERVEIPFRGRPGEGERIVGLLRHPSPGQRLPLVLDWGGIDSFKEERRTEPYVQAGFAVMAMDMPGVADAPIDGSEDAERMWDAVFDWVPTRPDLDPKRVAVVGGSTGGYWATKLAHTHRERIAAAITQGGCAHYAFSPEWIEQSQHGEYPFELAETLACAFGRSTFEEWVEYAPRLSLLNQGILERPCAPLLLINGLHDSTFPIKDMYLLLEHGDPKTARFYDADHMGHTSRTTSDMLRWLRTQLGP